MSPKEIHCQRYRQAFIDHLLQISKPELTLEQAKSLAQNRCHPEVLMEHGMQVHEEGAKLLARKVAFELDLY